MIYYIIFIGVLLLIFLTDKFTKKRKFLVAILWGLFFFISVIILFVANFDKEYLKDKEKEYDNINKYYTRVGIVVNVEGKTIDSVNFFNYKNEIIAHTDSVGYFKITGGEDIFYQAITLEKKNYITDTIYYYNKILNEWNHLYTGYNDTIILKRK